MSALKHLLDRYHEGTKLTDLETLVVIARNETAAEELAALRQVQAERDALKVELAKMLLVDFADVYSPKREKADNIASKFWDTWQEVEVTARGDE